MPRKQTVNQIDKKIDRIFAAHCSNVPINVLNIGKIFTAGRAVAQAGGDDAALRQAVIAKVNELREDYAAERTAAQR